jgi:hypothetical protein
MTQNTRIFPVRFGGFVRLEEKRGLGVLFFAAILLDPTGGESLVIRSEFSRLSRDPRRMRVFPPLETHYAQQNMVQVVEANLPGEQSEKGRPPPGDPQRFSPVCRDNGRTPRASYD